LIHNSNQVERRKEVDFYNILSELTGKVVDRYIARGVIPRREKEDVETAIIEKFLRKRDKIDRNFHAKAKRKTYYIAVINRMSAEVIRKENKHWYAVNDMHDGGFIHDTTFSFETAKETLLKEELKRFQVCLTLFDSLQSKLILFLKYQYNVPLNASDINNYAGKSSNEAEKLLKGRNSLSKTMVNHRLAQLVQLVEHKEISGDAVRMWLNKQTESLINRLNGNNQSFHNKETIGVMLEMQYGKENSNFHSK